jgi:hypothetical protein
MLTEPVSPAVEQTIQRFSRTIALFFKELDQMLQEIVAENATTEAVDVQNSKDED